MCPSTVGVSLLRARYTNTTVMLFALKKVTPTAPTLGGFFPSFPGTKDIRQHPVFRGSLSRWAWKVYTHRLTRAGRWFVGLTLITLFAAAPSLDLQSFIVLLYLGGLWVVAGLGTIVCRPRVTVRARHASRVAAGETLRVEVEITQGRGLVPGIELQVLPERLPLLVDADPPDGVSAGPLLKSGETRRVTLGLYCSRRGEYTLRGWRVETDFPFGLLHAWRYYAHESALLVYPALAPLSHMDIPTGRRSHPGGVALASRLGDSFEFLGNREFRMGDNIRDIDWRATARMGGDPVILREYREEFFLRVAVVLDTYAPGGRGVKPAARQARHESFERAVSLTASVADYLSRQEYLVDVFAAGAHLHYLTDGRAGDNVDRILDILACVTTTDTEPLDSIAPQLFEFLEQITTVVCVFGQWDETRHRFVENLRMQGAGVKIILVRGGGVDTLAPPPDATLLEPADWDGGITRL